MEVQPALTAQELAGGLELVLKGDGALRITGAATLEEAGPGHLSFVASARFFAAGSKSEAGCLIVPAEFPDAGVRTVMVSAHPRAHFARAIELLYPVRQVCAGIHPSAIVDPSARIDPAAEIGAYVTIGAGARVGPGTRVDEGSTVGAEAVIGPDCVLYPRVTLYPGVTLGARCIIHSGAVIGADGFGFEMAGDAYRKVPQVGMVEIGDDVEIGANTCIDRAALGVTRVGNGSKLDNMVHIAHNCRIGRHVVIAAQTGLAGGVSIGDYAIVGGQVGIGDKARIEPRAVIGSGAGILTSKIVRAGEPVWGTPARPLRQYLGQLAELARFAKRRGQR